MAIPITATLTFFTPATCTTASAAVVHKVDRSEAADPVPVVANRQAVALVLAVEAVAGFPPEGEAVAEVLEGLDDIHACTMLGIIQFCPSTSALRGFSSRNGL